MGYRPPWPADWQAATEMVLADEAQYLATADLYVLAPHLWAVVIAAAQTLGGRAACGASRAHLPLPRREVLPLAVQGVEVMSRDPRMRGEPWAVGGKIHRQAAGGQPGSLGEIIVYPVADRHAVTGPGHVQPEPRLHHELAPAFLVPHSPFVTESSLSAFPGGGIGHPRHLPVHLGRLWGHCRQFRELTGKRGHHLDIGVPDDPLDEPFLLEVLDLPADLGLLGGMAVIGRGCLRLDRGRAHLGEEHVLGEGLEPVPGDGQCRACPPWPSLGFFSPRAAV